MSITGVLLGKYSNCVVLLYIILIERDSARFYLRAERYYGAHVKIKWYYSSNHIRNLRKMTIKYEDSLLITPININWLLIISCLMSFGFPGFDHS